MLPRAIRSAGPFLLLSTYLVGCGYVFTYDDAIPEIDTTVHFDVERWDPPDSLAFALPEPPRVEAVIQDAYWYSIIHPRGEEEFKAAQNSRSRAQSRGQTYTGTPQEDQDFPPISEASDTLWVYVDPDSLGNLEHKDPDKLEPEKEAAPRQPIQIDLTPNEERLLIERTETNLKRAQGVVSRLEKKAADNKSLSSQLDQILSFVQGAQTSLGNKNYRGADTLALKAWSLADEVSRQNP
ncbi:MAG: hypothetical protein HKN21_12895 [Candidatus Eisenbacteria bacterium]|uniref:Uncharacterized protein n=1 Tax=Eiseniibacteriota bacterium TaxID=2212470 RepID=A0A7Y2EB42_UNCEI|nr:hypothetical protein [Candidatus Eisenbacteria bacterium]